MRTIRGYTALSIKTWADTRQSKSAAFGLDAEGHALEPRVKKSFDVFIIRNLKRKAVLSLIQPSRQNELNVWFDKCTAINQLQSLLYAV